VEKSNLHSEPKRVIQLVNGTSYVYEDVPYWDKTLKQNRHKRKCIGKLDDNKCFSPNEYYRCRQLESLPLNKDVSNLDNVQSNSSISQVKRCYFGATYLLSEIAKLTGVTEDLSVCFPNNYEAILSLAFYLILEISPIYRFRKWSHDHWHPQGVDIPSQRSSELLNSISEHNKVSFFYKQCKRRMEEEYLAYDTTSISSMSDLIKAVRFGHNKDNDDLPQVNVAMLFGESSGLPLPCIAREYFRRIYYKEAYL
jgi:hypothetical protein